LLRIYHFYFGIRGLGVWTKKPTVDFRYKLFPLGLMRMLGL